MSDTNSLENLSKDLIFFYIGVVFCLLSIVIHKNLQETSFIELDFMSFMWAESLIGTFFALLPGFLHVLFTSLPLITIVFCLYVVRFRKYFYNLHVLVLLAVSVSLPFLLKYSFKRNRPMSDVTDVTLFSTEYSFPSMHAYFSLFFVGLVLYFFYKFKNIQSHRTLLVTTSLLYVLIFGLTRVYFQEHYMTDVLAGFLFSASALSVFIGIDKLVDQRSIESLL